MDTMHQQHEKDQVWRTLMSPVFFFWFWSFISFSFLIQELRHVFDKARDAQEQGVALMHACFGKVVEISDNIRHYLDIGRKIVQYQMYNTIN